MTHQEKNSGFTLLEFLIAFAIFIIIVGTVIIFMRDFITLGTLFESTVLVERELEAAAKGAVSEIREATQSSVGGYAIEIALPNSLAFYSNIDGDPLLERIHYFLDGTDLKKSVVKPAGQPLTYSTTTAQETLRTLLRNIDVGTTTPLFLYRGEFATSTPTTGTLFLEDIRLVILRFTVDADPQRPPPSVNIFNVVNLRNLKNY
ncbi:MAG: prepilin-type N-terminal cleavage/methylation domain-containing protein [Patescibacteria group bacterium]